MRNPPNLRFLVSSTGNLDLLDLNICSSGSRKVLPADGASSPIKAAHDQDPTSSPVVPTRKRKREEQEIDIADRVRQNKPVLDDGLTFSKPPVDFFGRLMAPRPGQPGGSSTLEIVQAFKVSYKYNEGMSAAVRKPVKISALLM